jgi:hypothetical protein
MGDLLDENSTTGGENSRSKAFGVSVAVRTMDRYIKTAHIAIYYRAKMSVIRHAICTIFFDTHNLFCLLIRSKQKKP